MSGVVNGSMFAMVDSRMLLVTTRGLWVWELLFRCNYLRVEYEVQRVLPFSSHESLAFRSRQYLCLCAHRSRHKAGCGHGRQPQ